MRDAGFDPVVVGKLADARRFQRGAPGYGQAVSAAELKQKLSLTPWARVSGRKIESSQGGGEKSNGKYRGRS